ncbi:proline/glycine betaine ABC transporter ATP-binding protein [Aureimonas endophytica]|uniref:Quaternary amine transport ATP-binding protein n=1 Tax=Aureimonas endophytica TaxID=2027858 RepID=A0A916ZS25_9HYPH|nr:glycine betaine/L-proline ABC transporter ATP-binding protein [Aureimonas endophytica]GGE10106.1 proline/glycine betaine ABC transporter ATP-binding protein [Aureimonas endophytica]
MAERAPGIEIRRLCKIFGANGAAYVDAVRNGMTKAELNATAAHVLGLRDINIAMPGGGIQVIMGLSGSGKSTLIRHINRLIDPTAGEVIVDGADVVKMSPTELRDFRRHKTAMVFQKFALLPHRNVLENTVYGLEVQGLPRRAQEEAAMRWLERVGLKGFEKKYPNQLSGGMQQRVGLARALSNDAPILLMDEAFSALDPLIRTDMQTVLLDIQKDVGKTIVFITHDLDEALRLGDRIAILRDGEMVQQGTRQDIVLRPADDYIANFVRHVNRGRVIQVENVMAPATGATATLPSVAVGTTLEAAAELFAAGQAEALAVVEADGRPVGQIGLRRILAAMVSPQGAAEDALPSPAEDEAVPSLDGAAAPVPLETIGRSVIRAQAG